MALRITKGYKQLLAEAEGMVTAITVDQARDLLHRDDHVFIDLRDVREVQREGGIPGAKLCPRGMLEFWIDPESPYHKPLFAEDKTFVFFCAAAWRSALAARTAIEMGLNPVVHIAGGFTAWRDAGMEVERRDAKPRPESAAAPAAS
ncbi:MAG: rhodanese-like domain-containing protein [Hyphomicrobiales bacterium]|nr:rhodanese-like domain-containing protein [Hyphomicrobiales bacterium]MCP5372223.1 rhodanese-like domain-containing protein [Hyphomicrobiales bacterium]